MPPLSKMQDFEVWHHGYSSLDLNRADEMGALPLGTTRDKVKIGVGERKVGSMGQWVCVGVAMIPQVDRKKYIYRSATLGP